MRKRYVVRLTPAERASLQRLIARGRAPARQLTHARIVLKADQGPDGPAWTDAQIVTALDVSRPTVQRVRKRCAEEGLAAALVRRPPRATKPRKLDGRQEAHLIALACSTPPEGRQRWTLRLLAERYVALYAGPPISDELVRRTLKQNDLKPWLKERWCIPPTANAEFVWHMEDVLDVYTRPYDPRRPQVCLDELSKQLLADARPPLPCAPGHPAREDYEYTRQGTANLFLCYVPLRGWRRVWVTARRTRVD
jgi:transposase